MKTDNELIAEFMGFGLLDETPVSKTKIFKLTDKNGDPIHPYYGPMRGEQMRFGSSWDWLMPVVEKITLISTGDDDFFYPRTFGMRDADGNYMFRFNRFHLITAKTLIEAAHGSVVEFIKWYNAQPK